MTEQVTEQTQQSEEIQMTFGQAVLQELIPIIETREDIKNVYTFFCVILDRLHLTMGSTANKQASHLNSIILSDAINEVRKTAVITCNAMLYGDHIELDIKEQEDEHNS